MTKALQDKVAVVTGGGSGIGAAIARRFAAEGAKVVVAGRREAALEAVTQPLGAMAVVTDVVDEDQVRALFKAVDDAHGRLDVLVNNAGVTGPTMAIEDMDIEQFDQTLDINVRGLVLTTKHALPMLKRQGGSIVNMASRMGLTGTTPRRSPYTASKFAVVGITETTAQEVGRYGIRVNSLCPGAVNGELMVRVVASRAQAEGLTEGEVIAKHYTAAAALGRWVEPEEVAAAALFLASNAAASITGAHIKVDAGRK